MTALRPPRPGSNADVMHRWLTEQHLPVTTSAAARHLGVSQRTARDVLERAHAIRVDDGGKGCVALWVARG